MSSLVSAQNLQYAQNGVYVGLTLPFNKLEGDFDGKTVVIDAYSYETIVIPRINSKSGFGVALGARSDIIAGEMSYHWSQHDDDWMGYKGVTNFNILNLDSKLFIATDQQIQPYLLLGVAYSWLVVEDGSVDYYSYDDANLYGFGFNIGGGLAIYLNPRLAIGGGITYRYLEYSTMDGVSGETIELEKPVVGSAISFNAGLTLTFK